MNETFDLKLARQHVQLILDSLAEMPFKVSDPVIREVIKQVNDQLPKQEPPQGLVAQGE